MNHVLIALLAVAGYAAVIAVVAWLGRLRYWHTRPEDMANRQQTAAARAAEEVRR